MVLPRIPVNFCAVHLFSELDLYLVYNLSVSLFCIQDSSTDHVEDFPNQLTWRDETLQF